MQALNPRIERARLVNPAMLVNSKSATLVNTKNDLVEVVLYKWDNTLSGNKYFLYWNSYHDDHPGNEHSTLGTSSIFIDEWSVEDEAAAMEAFDKASQGYVKCNECGRWVKYEDARIFVPAGCSCKNEECIKSAQEKECDFFSMPLD